MTKNLIDLTGKVAIVTGAGRGHKPKTDHCESRLLVLQSAFRDLAARHGAARRPLEPPAATH